MFPLFPTIARMWSWIWMLTLLACHICRQLYCHPWDEQGYLSYRHVLVFLLTPIGGEALSSSGFVAFGCLCVQFRTATCKLPAPAVKLSSWLVRLVLGGFLPFFGLVCLFMFFLTRKKNKDLKFYGVCVCMCGFPGKSALQFKSDWSVLVMPVPTAAASASSSFRTKLNWTWEDGKLLVQRKGMKPNGHCLCSSLVWCISLCLTST